MKKIPILLICMITVFALTGCKEEKVSLNDGVYFGESSTFPGASVEVTVSEGKISNVEVVEAGGNPDYYGKAVAKIPDEIVKKQSVNVDAVTGATKTSICIMEAVEEALAKVKG